MKHPIYYLPPIEWWHNYYASANAELDFDEPYKKQTYYNHCLIDSPQGSLKLTVPIKKAESLCHDTPLLMRDIRISEHGDWRYKHWHALETTYYNSPFFEYLQYDFKPIFEKHFDFLIDFNIELIEVCKSFLQMPTLQKAQDSKFKAQSSSAEIQNTKQREYYQVFAHKHGFTPNLSIIDLIFNMGNEAPLYIVNQ
ncbi:MAG: WbqC family protein [Bacteroidaceae bacterium]|nr:WbqC family protein [Bacteroidaceae bacterium]